MEFILFCITISYLLLMIYVVLANLSTQRKMNRLRRELKKELKMTIERFEDEFIAIEAAIPQIANLRDEVVNLQGVIADLREEYKDSPTTDQLDQTELRLQAVVASLNNILQPATSEPGSEEGSEVEGEEGEEGEGSEVVPEPEVPEFPEEGSEVL